MSSAPGESPTDHPLSAGCDTTEHRTQLSAAPNPTGVQGGSPLQASPAQPRSRPAMFPGCQSGTASETGSKLRACGGEVPTSGRRSEGLGQREKGGPQLGMHGWGAVCAAQPRTLCLADSTGRPRQSPHCELPASQSSRELGEPAPHGLRPLSTLLGGLASGRNSHGELQAVQPWPGCSLGLTVPQMLGWRH